MNAVLSFYRAPWFYGLACAILLPVCHVKAQQVTPRVSPAARLPLAPHAPVDFVKSIQPIFAKACYSCHGRQTQEAGLRLDLKANALKGGEHGAVIVANHSDQSKLFQLIAGLDHEIGRMPPEGGGEPLSVEQIGLLRTWIDEGAAWPDKADKLWSLEPIVRPNPPRLKNAAWVRNSIDAFLLARLEQENVEPSREADRATLLRRLYLDLIGLPPSREEVEAYLSDTRADAYERVVNRLLSSPHYGERWGRHWLDAARYADSDGYENDRGRPFAWRYRDWVIDSLNRDMPFDQFSIQQLAGDLLRPTDREYADNARIATGFHRNTPVNKENGVDPEEDRVKRTLDRTNTTGTVWLGLTIGCANCHDHKYDPISQAEYFQLYAFFNNLDEVNVSVQADDKITEIADTTPQDADVPGNDDNPINQSEDRNESQFNKAAVVVSVDPSSNVASKPAKKKTAAENNANNAMLLAQAVQESPQRRPAYIHERGDFLVHGKLVVPKTPTALPPLSSGKTSQNRLDLARWLFAPDNPLTARVAVNRLWQAHFGCGLVVTDGDFGTQGERPSHPELLDWLACELRDGGWRLKPLHRLIVTSSTYRQSAANRRELHQRDPYNTWLARQNRYRVDAEIVRDMALAVSGLLDRTVGGPSIYPPRPENVTANAFAFNNRNQWAESHGPDRYRRGMYIWFHRTSPYPSLATFDAPDSNVSCTRRERSNTPLQALTLLNDVVFTECANAIADRMRAKPSATEGREAVVEAMIRDTFFECFSRPPSGKELAILSSLYADARAMRKDLPATDAESAARLAVSRAILNSDEFITRE